MHPRRLIVLTLAALCFSAFWAPKVVAQDSEPPTTHRILNSGLRVWEFEGAPEGTFNLVVYVAAGSRQEHPGEEGLAHLVEHCMFRSTKKRDSRVLLMALDEMGASINGLTSYDFTAYTFSVPMSNWRELVRLVGDMITNPKFAPADVEKEAKLVIDELGRGAPAPDVQSTTLEKLIYPGSRMSRGIGGTAANIREHTPSRVEQWWKRHYHAGNMAIAWSGSVSGESVVPKIETEFSEVLPKKDSASFAVPEVKLGGQLHPEAESARGKLIWGYHIPHRTPKNLVRLLVLERLLYNPMFSELRTEEALAYEHYVRFVNFRGAWRFELVAGSSEQKLVPKLRHAFEKVVSHIGGMDRAAFMRACAAVRSAFSPSTSSGLATAANLTWIVMDLGLNARPDLHRELDKLDWDDTKTFALKTFVPPNHYYITSNPSLLDRAIPWAWILGGFIAVLLVFDGLMQFRIIKTIIGTPVHHFQEAKLALHHHREFQRVKKERSEAVDQLEADIQEWYTRQEEQPPRG